MRPAVPASCRNISPGAASAVATAASAAASKRATARSRKSCVHWATSRFTVPSPCSCSVSVPRNLSVAASSTEAATAWPSSSSHRGGYSAMSAQLAPGALQVHPVPANRLILEHEATDLIAREHVSRFHGEQNGGHAKGFNPLSPRTDAASFSR